MSEIITCDPDVMNGEACIRGMRISVSLVQNLLINGMTTDEIISEYPYLTDADVEAVQSQS